ncbi:MAG: hypothetical protein LUD19_03395 [Clostridia bacterium]|nr:hypothetical protein [Clostridia bacterium]
MSVPQGDRGKSGMQFVETADRIEQRAMEVCRKWAKSFMFIITQRTVALASSIYEHAQAANAIIPQTEDERQERILELERALGANYAFARKIERAYSMFPLCGVKEGRGQKEEDEKSGRLLEEFMNLCLDEEEALKGNIHYTRTMKLHEPKSKKKPGNSTG